MQHAEQNKESQNHTK